MSLNPLKKQKNNERGVYLILIAPILIVLFSFAAISIGLGLVMTSKTRVKNSLELASQSALSKFVETQGSSEQKFNAALAEANKYVNDWKIPLSDSALVSDLIAYEPDFENSRNFMQMGIYYSKEPASGEEACTDGIYPCFKGVPFNYTGPITPNALRLKVQNSAESPFLIPFAKVVSFFDKGIVSAEVVASTKSKCTVFALDVSKSSVADTHMASSYWYWDAKPITGSAFDPSYDPNISSVYINRTRFPNPRAFAFHADKVSTWSRKRCVNDLNTDIDNDGKVTEDEIRQNDGEVVHWCNLSDSERNSYLQSNTRRGSYLIDRDSILNNKGPEPLRSWLLGIHTALKHLKDNSSGSDKYAFLAFSKKLIDKIPSNGMISNPDPLIQLTNVTDSLDESPNFIERGWFGTMETEGTNIDYVLTKASEILNDPNSCDPDSLKTIVIASDGILNSTYWPYGVQQYEASWDGIIGARRAGHLLYNNGADQYGYTMYVNDGESSSNPVLRSDDRAYERCCNPANFMYSSDLILSAGLGNVSEGIDSGYGSLIRNNIRVATLYGGKHAFPHIPTIKSNASGNTRSITLEEMANNDYRAAHGIARTGIFSIYYSGMPDIGLPTLPTWLKESDCRDPIGLGWKQQDTDVPGEGLRECSPWFPEEIKAQCAGQNDLPTPHKFYERRLAATMACAYQFASEIPGIKFHLGEPLLAEVSWGTGGNFCPVLPIGPSGNYELDYSGQNYVYKESLREEGKPLLYAEKFAARINDENIDPWGADQEKAYASSMLKCLWPTNNIKFPYVLVNPKHKETGSAKQ